MQWRKRVKSSSLAPLQHAFSHLPDKTWAISASREWLIGIDAACNSEFSQPYPLHKVFHPQELSRMEPAQIWSAKEAVAKAIQKQRAQTLETGINHRVGGHHDEVIVIPLLLG